MLPRPTKETVARKVSGIIAGLSFDVRKFFNRVHRFIFGKVMNVGAINLLTGRRALS